LDGAWPGRSAAAVDASEFLQSLKDRGATVWFDNEQLRWRAPRGAIYPEEIAQLRLRRAEFVNLLSDTLCVERVPLERHVGAAKAPLTGMQRMPWYLIDRPHPRTMSFGLRLQGPLDLALLETCLNCLVRRHETLRTRILITADGPIQKIDEYRPRSLRTVNISSDFDQSSDIKSIHPRIQEFIDQSIDPSIGPLFDTTIFRITELDHILAISVDHVISDASSLFILNEELWTLYLQGARGHACDLPAPTLQFSDYALWLESIHDLWYRTHGSYWVQRFSSSPKICWPSDAELVEQGAKDHAFLTVPIASKSIVVVTEIARREQTIPALVVLAMYVMSVFRWSEQRDLTIAIVDSGRHRSGLARMVGLLASNVHLRCQLASDLSYHRVLNMVKSEFSSALAHRDFDWLTSVVPEYEPDLLFNWISLNPNESIHPDFDVQTASSLKVSWLDLSASEGAFAGIDFQVPYKLGLICNDEGGRIALSLFYRTSFVSAVAIEQLASDFRSVLESAATQ